MLGLNSGRISAYRILRSQEFVQGLRFILILAGSNLALLAIVVGLFSLGFNIDTSREFETEFALMQDAYQNGGVEAVVEKLDSYDDGIKRHKYAYMLLDKNGAKLLGQLDTQQNYLTVSEGWFKARYLATRNADAPVNTEFISDRLDFSNGYSLVLATFIGEKRQIFLDARDYVFASIGFTFFLGVSIIVISIVNVFRSLEPINRDIDIVMAGNLSHRIEIESRNTELGKLILHVNEMLDRIQELMLGVKQVSDNIAHDLRTPLTRLRNNLASYEKRVGEDNKEIVRDLIDEADHLIATFNALLRIARIELGETPERKELVSLDELVYEVVELYEPVAAEKGVLVDVNLKRAKISAERNLIFQAVANIIDNAIKYTPQGGDIAVKLYRAVEDGKVALSVSDSGCGIKEENHEKVFRRFFREDSSRASHAGNGLGLSLVAAVLKIHDASVALNNGDPGLEVVVTFPGFEIAQS